MSQYGSANVSDADSIENHNLLLNTLIEFESDRPRRGFSGFMQVMQLVLSRVVETLSIE